MRRTKRRTSNQRRTKRRAYREGSEQPEEDEEACGPKRDAATKEISRGT